METHINMNSAKRISRAGNGIFVMGITFLALAILFAQTISSLFFWAATGISKRQTHSFRELSRTCPSLIRGPLLRSILPVDSGSASTLGTSKY